MSSRSVEITSNDDRAVADVDEVDGALVTQTVIHRNVHRGWVYSADYGEEGVADDGVIEVLIQVAADQPCHAHFIVDAGGDYRSQLFEGTTTSSAGTAMTVSNRNRSSTNTASTTITHTPTITGDGTEIEDALRAGGQHMTAPGSHLTGFSEWMLKTNETYLIRVTNLAGTPQLVNIQVDFYEPE